MKVFTSDTVGDLNFQVTQFLSANPDWTVQGQIVSTIQRVSVDAKGRTTARIQYLQSAVKWSDLASTDIVFVIDGGGSAITTGIKGDLKLDFACLILGWTILGDQSGSIQIDLWKDVESNYPPTVAGTITGSAKPIVSASTNATSITLTGWTTTINAGDCLRINVDSSSTFKRVSLVLRVVKL